MPLVTAAIPTVPTGGRSGGGVVEEADSEEYSVSKKGFVSKTNITKTSMCLPGLFSIQRCRTSSFHLEAIAVLETAVLTP